MAQAFLQFFCVDLKPKFGNLILESMGIKTDISKFRLEIDTTELKKSCAIKLNKFQK